MRKFTKHESLELVKRYSNSQRSSLRKAKRRGNPNYRFKIKELQIITRMLFC